MIAWSYELLLIKILLLLVNDHQRQVRKRDIYSRTRPHDKGRAVELRETKVRLYSHRLTDETMIGIVIGSCDLGKSLHKSSCRRDRMHRRR
jgi:hypothetical protein